MVQEYLDNAGLYRKYGPDKATAKKAGEYRMYGKYHEIECKITLSGLTQSEIIQDDIVVIPAGARIQEVELQTETLAATGVAIDVGLIKTDRTTEIDYDGLLAAAPLAVMDAAGERTIYTASTTLPSGATGTGALIGTTTAFTGHITASATTATAFTAGVVWVKIRYYMP